MENLSICLVICYGIIFLMVSSYTIQKAISEKREEKKRFKGMSKRKNPKEISKFLKQFEEVWNEYPDFRFGQLLYNVCRPDLSLFYVEDKYLIKQIKEFYEISKEKKDEQ